MSSVQQCPLCAMSSQQPCFLCAFENQLKLWKQYLEKVQHVLHEKSLIEEERDVILNELEEVEAEFQRYVSSGTRDDMFSVLAECKVDEIKISNERLQANYDVLESLLFPDLPKSTPDPYWQTIAFSSCSSIRFHPVIVCDRDKIDDPFWPRHVSIIYTVQVRRTTIDIFQVSLLNGSRKVVRTFDQQEDEWGDEIEDVKCFQSAGVIFVYVTRGRQTVYIYDTRHQVSWMLLIWSSEASCLLISCIGRITSDDETLRGWRIRMITAINVRGEAAVENRPWRVCLCQDEIEVRFGSRGKTVKKHDDIIFGSYYVPPRFRFVRTSRGMIGLYAESVHSADGSAMLYDDTRGYVYCASFQDLLKLDRPFAAYFYTPTPTGSLHGDSLCPTVLSDRECVECQDDGRIDRTDFAPPMLKFAAARALFRSSVDVQRRMSSYQFWMATGIRGMEPHFGKIRLLY